MARTVAERSDAVLALAETFRRHGLEGASLSTIRAETGLGRGSLYHFFPGGKEEMAAAVLHEVSAWFAESVNAPLRGDRDPAEQLSEMFEQTARYFESRQLVCLFGAFALGQERERFARSIREYFADWIDALSDCLTRAGSDRQAAQLLATDIVSGIQGALVLSRALQNPGLFRESLTRLRARADPAPLRREPGDLTCT
jgi:AcrR family transcriptional regulator